MENVEGGVASCTNEQQLMYNTLQSTQVAYNDAQTYISNYVNKLLEQAEKTGVAKNELYNLAAQMVAVISDFCAITERRSYREAIEKEQALEILQKNSGVRYNPQIVDIMTKISRQLR